MLKTHDETPATPVQQMSADKDPTAALIEALEKVCRIGVFYPPGHALCDAAASRFLDFVPPVVGKAARLRLEVRGGSLHVQGVEMDADLKGVAHFRDLLDQLGIARVEVDRDIAAAELHEFVTRLLALRKQLRGLRGFQHFDIDGMPESVRIYYRRFLNHGGDGSGDSDSTSLTPAQIDELIEALAQASVEPPQLAACRRLLEDLALRRAAYAGDRGELPAVGWNDVRELLLRAAELDLKCGDDDSGPDRAENLAYLEDLASLVTKLSGDESGAAAQETVDLILSLSRRGRTESDPSEPEASADSQRADRHTSMNDHHDLSIAELSEALVAYVGQAPSAADLNPEDLRPADRCEELSILLLMLSRDQEIPTRIRVEKRLRALLVSPLQAVEWETLIAGIRQLLVDSATERLSDVVNTVLEALREAPERSPLALLAAVNQDVDPEISAPLWPFVVNELLLVGRGGEKDGFWELCELAGSLPAAVTRPMLPRLEQLTALRKRRIAPELLSSPPVPLMPVFAQLLDSTAGTFVCKRLSEAMRPTARDPLSKATLPLLGRGTALQRRFLAGLVEERAGPQSSHALMENGARIVVEALPDLPRARRSEPWVLDAIRLLGRTAVAGAPELLRRIVRERRNLFWRAWPAACRDVAREALAAGTSGADDR